MKPTPAGILAAGFLALLPFVTTNQLFYGPVNAKFFFVVFVVNVLALIAAYHLYAGKKLLAWKGRWLAGTLVLVVLTQYAASVSGVFFERSLWSDIFWSSGVLFLTHVAFLAVLFAGLLTERDWSLVRRATAISAGFFSLLLIFGIQGLGFTGKFLWTNLGERSLTIGNETYAGAYLFLAFMVGSIEFFRTKGWSLWRIVLLASLSCIALSPFLFNIGILLGKVPLSALIESPSSVLGLARASSAALGATVLVLLGHFLFQKVLPKPWSTRATIAWGGLILLGVVGAMTLLFTPGSFIQESYIKESSAARIIVWEASGRAFQERPILGWGPENFNYAIEQHFDNRLFEEENLGEIWFERAHNVFLDTLVGSGVVGTVAFVLLTLVFMSTVYRARKRDHIKDTEALILYMVIPAHLLQTLTGFDTIGSYALLAVMGGYALWLENKIVSGKPQRTTSGRTLEKVVAGVLVVAVIVSVLLTLGEYDRQAALPLTFKGKSAIEQQGYMEQSLARTSSFESLRLSSGSFIKGSLAVIAEKATEERTARILEFCRLYETHYQEYLAAQPNHYRARMNYAYLLLIMTTLGENRIEDAKQVINESYALSPGNPLTYVLGALAALYSGDLKESDRLMAEALAINPDIPFTIEAAAYFKEQKKLFPNLTVLKLTNL